MDQLRRPLLVASIIACFLIQAQGADKYTDQSRPYEFGFSIDGQQHRHEKKDKNGIIMGEFGFVTADDVYHVTVYATDENGRFKILSMKNIHLKSQSATSSRQGHSLQLQPVPQSLPAIQTSTQKPEQEFEPISLEPPANSCSHCSLPTSTRAPEPAIVASSYPGQHNANNVQYPQLSVAQNYPRQQLNQNFQHTTGFEQSFPGGQHTLLQGPSIPQSYPQQAFNGGPSYPQSPGVSQSYPQQATNGGQYYPQSPSVSQNYPVVTQNYPSAQNNRYDSPQYTAQVPGTVQAEQTYPQSLGGSQNELGTSGGVYPEQGAQPQSGGSAGSRSPKKYSGISGQPLNIPGTRQQYYPRTGITNSPGITQEGTQITQKPTLAYAQMQIVDKNTEIYAKRPGEKEGLPNGLTKDDMVHLLYTFNYTVGFQGHFEEGYTNGVKQGYYYVTGRNGVRTRVDYVADDKGFRPKITQDVLSLVSDDVPKPETEKDAKFGLKGYEFKWLYYPVESKAR